MLQLMLPLSSRSGVMRLNNCLRLQTPILMLPMLHSHMDRSYTMQAIPDIYSRASTTFGGGHSSNFYSSSFWSSSLFLCGKRLVCTSGMTWWLGSGDPCGVSFSNFSASEKLTSLLVALIIAHCATQTVNHDQVCQLKQTIRKNNREQQSPGADSPYDVVLTRLAKESGSSSWLTVLPMVFTSIKVTSGILCLYIMDCYHLIQLKHAIVELLFQFARLGACHNEVHNLTAGTLLTEVCCNVTTEPSLQLFLQTPFLMQLVILQMMLVIDVKARGFLV